jgi:hypothetical protein
MPHHTIAVLSTSDVMDDSSYVIIVMALYQVRTWEGDVADLPGAQFQGASALFLNAVFGNVFDQRSVLLAAATKLPPTAHIVISHPLGR